jgi:alkanesulfonate monooxygenase SsuD/methylene tetrahydromethanopterin reductase-like flavin-dependent oxidoreductase (luciferase family)
VTTASPRPNADPTQARRAWGLESPALGLSLAGSHDPGQARRHRHQVTLAESLGLHSVWLPEMHFAPGACSAPLIELAGYAATSERLRFGTTSLLLPLHPAEQMAAEIAALDRLSRGRLLLGLGRGFNKKMLAAFDVPAARKRDRFDAALERLLALWREGNADGSGLATHQQPHPPLAVAAFGPKGLAQAARHGLPYLASPVETLDQIAENQARHREQLRDPSRPALSIVMRTVFVSDRKDDLARALGAARREMAWRRQAGVPDAVRRALEAPLEERVVFGSAETVTERLVRDRRRLGTDLLIVRAQPADVGDEAIEHSLVRLAREVWPAVVEATR